MAQDILISYQSIDPKKRFWHIPCIVESDYLLDRLIIVMFISVIDQVTGLIKLFLLSIVLNVFIDFILF